MRMLILTCATLGLFAADVASTNAQNPIVPAGAKLEKLFTRETGIEGGLTEGPAVAPDGSIYFSDITQKENKGRILRFDPKPERQPSLPRTATSPTAWLSTLTEDSLQRKVPTSADAQFLDTTSPPANVKSCATTSAERN